MNEADEEDKGVSYPPTAVLAFEQLSWLRPTKAFALFQLLELGSLLLVIWLLVWAGESADPLSRWAKLSLSGLIVFFYPVSEQFHSGAINIMLLALLLTTMRGLQRRQDLRAGVALALASLLKVFPGITLLYLILWKRWRLIQWFLATSFILSVITIGFVGLHNSLSYLTRLRALNLTQNGPFSLKAFVLHLFKYTLGLPLGPVGQFAYVTSTAIVETIVVLLAIRGTILTSRDHDGEERSFGLWLVTMVLLSPTSWAHYGVFFIPTLVCLGSRYLKGTAPRRALVCGCGTYGLGNVIGLLFVGAINGPSLPIIGHRGYHFASMLWVYGLFFPVGILAFATAYFLCVEA